MSCQRGHPTSIFISKWCLFRFEHPLDQDFGILILCAISMDPIHCGTLMRMKIREARNLLTRLASPIMEFQRTNAHKNTRRNHKLTRHHTLVHSYLLLTTLRSITVAMSFDHIPIVIELRSALHRIRSNEEVLHKLRRR